MKKSAIARLVKCKPDEAEVRAPDFVAKLKDAQARAAGAAPRPEAKPNDLINELAATSGRDLVKRLAEEEKTASDLLVALDAQAAKIAVREPHWKQLDTLIGYLPELPEAPAITAERNAIHDGRLLLDDPDKVQPGQSRCRFAAYCRKPFVCSYQSEYDLCAKEIEAAPEWAKLAPEDRAAILREVHLSAPEATPKLGTLSELIDSLATCSPQRWAEKRDALRGQLTRALNLASLKLEPKVQPVTPPRRILRTESDLEAWVDEVRKAVLAKLADGPVQL
jgi:hypothetical protein